jgi:hypothetical protein
VFQKRNLSRLNLEIASMMKDRRAASELVFLTNIQLLRVCQSRSSIY